MNALRERANIGKRVAALRAAHGDSLREAAKRTGVSHTTIARIESGEAAASYHRTIHRIAEGYGVTVEFLMTGRDPCQDFELSLRRLPPEERTRLYFISSQRRIRMVLQFLIAEFPHEFPPEKLAGALEVAPEVLQGLLEKGDAATLPDELCLKMGDSLAKLTGISRHWFRSGYIGGEHADSIPPEVLCSYLDLMKKAAKAGVKPDVLEMAIDLLIMRHSQVAPASARPHS